MLSASQFAWKYDWKVNRLGLTWLICIPQWGTASVLHYTSLLSDINKRSWCTLEAPASNFPFPIHCHSLAELTAAQASGPHTLSCLAAAPGSQVFIWGVVATGAVRLQCLWNKKLTDTSSLFLHSSCTSDLSVPAYLWWLTANPPCFAASMLAHFATDRSQRQAPESQETPRSQTKRLHSSLAGQTQSLDLHAGNRVLIHDTPELTTNALYGNIKNLTLLQWDCPSLVTLQKNRITVSTALYTRCAGVDSEQ